MDMLRVFENESYIQMFSQLKEKLKQTTTKSKNKKLQFNIPNKEYYNRKKTKQIYKTFQEQDVINNISNFFQNVGDYFKIYIDPIKFKNTILNTNFSISDI